MKECCVISHYLYRDNLSINSSLVTFVLQIPYPLVYEHRRFRSWSYMHEKGSIFLLIPSSETPSLRFWKFNINTTS